MIDLSEGGCDGVRLYALFCQEQCLPLLEETLVERDAPWSGDVHSGSCISEVAAGRSFGGEDEHGRLVWVGLGGGKFQGIVEGR